jgi:L-iditol 2-dehydrogenase
MKTLRLHGPGDLRLHEEPLPVPKTGESLLRIQAVGICGSDLHWFNEAQIGDAHLENPLILGHEFTALDENGQLVAIDPAVPCGECAYCKRGDPNLCENLLFAGHGEQDGALREWIAWPARCLYPLSGAFTAAEGALLEPLGIAMHAMNLAHFKLGMSLGVFGCGPIGLLILQLARLSGAGKLVATDILPHRVAAAVQFGADESYLVAKDYRDPDRALAAKLKLDIVFEAAGENSAVKMAVDALRPGGKVILVGIPADDRTVFSASVARRKGLTFKLVRRMKFTYPQAIQLVASGKIDLKALVSHTFPIEAAAEAFALAARREGLKIVITP